MKAILIATGNPGKLKEVKSIFKGLDIAVLSPEEFDQQEDTDLGELEVAETGRTLEENAQLKAAAFSEASGLPAMADDTGLMVEALAGFPGIKSDRWTSGSAEDKNLALLDKMSNIENRKAKFKTVVCLYCPESKKKKYFFGEVKGRISSKQKGSQGFGYDAVFIPEGYEQTFAQLGPEIKNQISHRHRALTKVKDFLKENKDWCD